MGNEARLPFPRGDFAHMGVTTLLSSDDPGKLAGRIYDVPDSVHGSGRMVKLRVVQNESGGDITIARKAVRFATGAGEFGAIIQGYVNADGQTGKPIDDAYTNGATWAENALGYLVEAGPCDVLSDPTTLGASANLGSLVQWENGGTIHDTAATTADDVQGIVDETQAATNTAYRVLVKEGLANIY